MMNEHDEFWEKEFLALSKIPDDESVPNELEERKTSTRLFVIIIGIIGACFCLSVTTSYLIVQGPLYWPLNLIFMGISVIGSLYVLLACFNWPIEETF